jgi:hypothetical protein
MQSRGFQAPEMEKDVRRIIAHIFSPSVTPGSRLRRDENEEIALDRNEGK